MASHFLAPFDQSEIEWNAWRNFCERFDEETGMDISSCPNVVKAVRLWGEELAELRLVGDPKHHVVALKEHREAVENN